MNRKKKPLYRKVNTRTYNVHHLDGGDFKNDRRRKRDTPQTVRGSMPKGVKRGLDYTPLYRFLLSKVGKSWDSVLSEVKNRLDRIEPLYHLVIKDEKESDGFTRVSESSYYSTLYVDQNGLLKMGDPSLTAQDLPIYCNCCTHTFNGVVYAMNGRLV